MQLHGDIADFFFGQDGERKVIELLLVMSMLWGQSIFSVKMELSNLEVEQVLCLIREAHQTITTFKSQWGDSDGSTRNLFPAAPSISISMDWWDPFRNDPWKQSVIENMTDKDDLWWHSWFDSDIIFVTALQPGARAEIILLYCSPRCRFSIIWHTISSFLFRKDWLSTLGA